MRRSLAFLAVSLAWMSPEFTTEAAASMPIPYRAVGCIENGKLRSGKSIFVIDPVTLGGRHPIDLGPYEGKTVQLSGFLTPDSRLLPSDVTKVADSCIDEMHRADALCHPCITVPPNLPVKPQ